MKNLIRIPIFVIAFALGLTALSLAPDTVHAANQVVTNCDNDAELRADIAAIQTDPTGGILSFSCGTKTILLSGTALPPITKYTSLDGGNKITLSGNNSSRIFEVAVGGSLNLYNITLTKGSSGGDGGAIYNNGTVTTSNAKFLENTAAASGGAIVSYGALHIVGGEFARNKGANGGAIYPRWGASSTTINSAWIHDNETTSTVDGWGGAILLWDGASATITNSNLDHNKARTGGAVYVFDNSSVTIDSSTLEANQATAWGGGAVYNEWLATIRSSTLSGNTAASSGGALDNYLNGNFKIINSTLSGNSANFGGAINNTKGDGSLINVTIVGNSAAFNGGGIDNGTYTGSGIDVKNTIVAFNPGGNCHDTNALSINSLGFNLSSYDGTCTQFFDQGGDQNGVDPLLGTLSANGGPTKTHLLLAGSPALNSGTGNGAPNTDQRGIPRPQGSAVDIGAVEMCAKPAKPALLYPRDGKKAKPPQVPLDWSDAVCASTYQVKVKLGAKNGPNAYTQKGITASQATTTTLTKGQIYFWRVTAINGAGKTKSAWQSFKVK